MGKYSFRINGTKTINAEMTGFSRDDVSFQRLVFKIVTGKAVKYKYVNCKFQDYEAFLKKAQHVLGILENNSEGETYFEDLPVLIGISNDSIVWISADDDMPSGVLFVNDYELRVGDSIDFPF